MNKRRTSWLKCVMLLAILAVVAAGAAAEKRLPNEDVVEVPAIGQGLCVANVFQDFSAIGYIFGRRVHLAAGVPVGLIDASVGGTTVETWTPEDVLRKIEGAETKALLKDWDDRIRDKKFTDKEQIPNRVTPPKTTLTFIKGAVNLPPHLLTILKVPPK